MDAVAGARAAPCGWRRFAVALRVIHPFPTLANVVAVALFAALAARGTPPAGAVARLMVTMFLIQSAIGAANDAFDVGLDRAAKPWKPIVAGALSRRAAALLAVTAALSACLLAATFGPAGWALAMAGLACGLAYDAGLKRTPLSLLTYLLALPLLPLWIWVALGRFSPALLWEYPLALLVGASLYLGNTAPDVEDDLAAGVSGLAHRLGRRGALAAAWGALGLALVLAQPLALAAGYDLALVVSGVGASTVLFAGAIALALRQPSPVGLRRSWAVLVLATIVFAVGWLAAAPR
jgi:4-hydroxybenzoate polyprenyltransferase